MKHEMNNDQEQLGEVIALLGEMFSGRARIPITMSTEGNPRLRGFFLDTDAGMGYQEANRFEAIVQIPIDNGHSLYLAEKYLANLQRTVWFKFDTESRQLYIKQIKGSEQPLDIWDFASPKDVRSFKSLLQDFSVAYINEAYENSEKIEILTHKPPYQFTTPELQ